MSFVSVAVDVFTICLFMYSTAIAQDFTTIEIESILSSSLISAHKISAESLNEIVSTESSGSDSAAHSYFYCGPLTDLKQTRKYLLKTFGVSSEALRTAFIDDRTNTGCLLTDLSLLSLSESFVDFSSSVWTALAIPRVMKLDTSTLNFFNKQYNINDEEVNSKDQSSNEYSSSLDVFEMEALDDALNTPKRLVIEFTPSSLSLFQSSVLGEAVLSGSDESAMIDSSPAWDDVIYSVDHNLGHLSDDVSSSGDTTGDRRLSPSKRRQLRLLDMTCVWPEDVRVSYLSRAMEILNIQLLEEACVVQMVQRAAASGSVLRILTSSAQRTQNFEVRGVIQSGTIYNEPFTAAGLTGSGQIVGVSDSGLNDLSCFLVDNSGAYDTINTDRSGTLQTSRRKVIQYTSSADGLDYRGGHGTHVAATILGSSVSSHSQMNGMAPGAKIVFLDCGDNNYIGTLSVPALYNKVFTPAYESGARVHANSWKDGDSGYGTYSYDVDHFTSDYDDFLAIFAAGNTGGYGASSVTAPSNSKNALSVGASEVRDLESDEVVTERTVAWFSGMGPTHDGRMKPDIIAPGSFVMSAFSGSPATLKDSLSSHSTSAATTCAAITGVGTSMSCPVAAGAALLIRQYFSDSSFWSSLCNSAYSQCQSGAFDPSGYLVKAVILHSGIAMHRYSTTDFDFKSTVSSKYLDDPPDSIQGYGGLTLSNVLPLKSGNGLSSSLDLIVFDAMEIEDYTTISWTITMSSSTSEPLKATICWYDPPSANGMTSRLLYHNLDLKVETPNGAVYWGNKVSGGDTYNTNEQIYIANAGCYSGSCEYKLYVSTYVLSEADVQKFALVITTSGTLSSFSSTTQSQSVSEVEMENSNTVSNYTAEFAEADLDTDFFSSWKLFHEDTSTEDNEESDKNEDSSADNESETQQEESGNTGSETEEMEEDSSASGQASSVSTTSMSTSQSSSSSSGSTTSATATVTIPETSMKCSTSSSGSISSDLVTLSPVSLSFTGHLKDVTMNLVVDSSTSSSSNNNQIDGFYAFIYAILITAPNGNSAQIGGYSNYPLTDNFYQREWPRSWCRYHTAGNTFTATRDVQSAGLSGSGSWTIQTTLAYSRSVSAKNYQGSIVMKFTSKSSSGGYSAEESDLSSSGFQMQQFPGVSGSQKSSMNRHMMQLDIIIVLVALCTVLFGVIYSYTLYKKMRKHVKQENDKSDAPSAHGLL